MSLLLLFNNPELYPSLPTYAKSSPLNTGAGIDADSMKGSIRVSQDAGIRGPFRWNSKEKEIRKYFEDN